MNSPILAGDFYILHEKEYLLKRKLIEEHIKFPIFGKRVLIISAEISDQIQTATVEYRGACYEIHPKWIRKKIRKKKEQRLGSEDTRMRFNTNIWKQRKLLSN